MASIMLVKVKMKIGFMGTGQIGSAWISIYRDVAPHHTLHLYDPWAGHTDDLKECDLVHLCFPCTSKEAYIKAVHERLDPARETNIFIHSTIQLGTSQALEEGTRWTVAHLPVRGVHPHLRTGIEEFVAFLGMADPTKDATFLETHLKSLGIEATHMKDGSRATELAKLMSTTYYGVCLAFHAEMKEMCEKAGVAYEDAVVEWNKTYNDGYGDKSHAVHRPNVVRPVFPNLTLPIGGHCVGPNAVLLSQIFPEAVGPQWIQKYSA